MDNTSKALGRQQPVIRNRVTPLVDQVFSQSGKLVAAGREYRPTQHEFALEAARCLDEDRSGLLEAATGTGKSFGILVPAILAATTGKRIVIAVATNALTEQLRADIPYVQNILGTYVKWAVVKGRAHSVCPLRAGKTRSEFLHGAWFGRAKLSPEEIVQLGDVLGWAREKENSDLTLYHETIPEKVRRLVTIDSDGCEQARMSGCSYAGERDEDGRWVVPCTCPFMLSRQKARDAEIVITNFNVLLWNYKLDGGIIGGFGSVILDEAHEWESTCRDFFSVKYSTGVFETLIKTALETYQITNGVSGIVNKISDAVNEFDNALREFAKIPFNYKKEFYEVLLDPIGDERMRLVNIVVRILDACRELVRFASDAKVSGPRLRELDKRHTVKRLLEALGGPDARANESNFAINISVGPVTGYGSPKLSLIVVPVHLGGYMKQTIHYSNARERAIEEANGNQALIAAAFADHPKGDVNVICVSATLTPDDKWDHPKHSFSMPADVVTCQVVSPFNYAKNAIWYVPSDMPSPSGEAGRDAHNVAATKQAARLVSIVGGRTLVLCSRTDDVNEAAKAISGLGFNVYKQLDAPPSKLTRLFKDDPTSCLVGSRTFGTGFDVPGGALECVIIWRLPFAHQDPVDKLLQNRLGRSKWMNLKYTPEMLLAYRQWIGRVIRQTTDIGVIAMLDSTKMSYLGNKLITAMPHGIRLVRSLSDVDSFLKARRGQR